MLPKHFAVSKILHVAQNGLFKICKIKLSYLFLFFSDIQKIQDGIGEKLAQFFQFFCAFLAGFIIGFIKGWKLTLVILAISPLLAISGGFMGKVH